jgi:hypothetical protein
MTIIIPNTFADKTGTVRLEDLDENFSSVVTGVNTEVTNIQNQVDTDIAEVQTTVDNIEDPVAMSLIFGSDPTPSVEPGTVVQTVYKRVDTKDTYAFATAGSLGTFIASLDTTITPKFANSLIHVQMCLTYEVHNDTVFILYRGATQIGRNSLDGNYWSGTWLPGYDADNNSTATTNHFFYMDTPATTDATTYRLMIQSGGIGATTFFLNRTVASAGQQNYEVAISQVILQEIAQ